MKARTDKYELLGRNLQCKIISGNSLGKICKWKNVDGQMIEIVPGNGRNKGNIVRILNAAVQLPLSIIMVTFSSCLVLGLIYRCN